MAEFPNYCPSNFEADYVLRKILGIGLERIILILQNHGVVYTKPHVHIWYYMLRNKRFKNFHISLAKTIRMLLYKE